MDGQFFSIPLNRVARTLPSVSQLIPSLTRLIEPPPILHKTILADIAGYDTTNRTHEIESSENFNFRERLRVVKQSRNEPRLPIIILARERERDARLSVVRAHIETLDFTNFLEQVRTSSS